MGIVVFSLFEKIVRYCDKYLSMVPLSFILGFYVKTVGLCFLVFPETDKVFSVLLIILCLSINSFKMVVTMYGTSLAWQV